MITLYVIESQVKKYRYVGITNDLRRRLKEHSKAKKTYVPFKVLLSETFLDYQAARIREKFLKSGQGRIYLDSIK
jgi:putative endonuclease